MTDTSSADGTTTGEAEPTGTEGRDIAARDIAATALAGYNPCRHFPRPSRETRSIATQVIAALGRQNLLREPPVVVPSHTPVTPGRVTDNVVADVLRSEIGWRESGLRHYGSGEGRDPVGEQRWRDEVTADLVDLHAALTRLGFPTNSGDTPPRPLGPRLTALWPGTPEPTRPWVITDGEDVWTSADLNGGWDDFTEALGGTSLWVIPYDPDAVDELERLGATGKTSPAPPTDPAPSPAPAPTGSVENLVLRAQIETLLVELDGHDDLLRTGLRVILDAEPIDQITDGPQVDAAAELATARAELAAARQVLTYLSSPTTTAVPTGDFARCIGMAQGFFEQYPKQGVTDD